MGWWHQDETGVSFADRDDLGVNPVAKPMLWGDSPADLIGNAIDHVIAAFLHDQGRLPSRAEVMAGITFSTAVLALPDRPEDCPTVTEEDLQVIDRHYYAAVHGEEPRGPGEDYKPIPAWRVEARKAVSAVISRLTEPYRSH